jgi:ribosomal protein S18 acetylase RimI-like enzyme
VDLKTRAYDEGDYNACRSLWVEVILRHRDIYADQSIGGDDPGHYFDDYLAKESWRGPWVAAVDLQVVGMVGIELDHEDAMIEPIVVSEDFRSRGIGEILATRAIEETRKMGLRSLSEKARCSKCRSVSILRKSGIYRCRIHRLEHEPG